MKRYGIVMLAVLSGVAGMLGGIAAVARPATVDPRFDPPVGPAVPQDTGAGEMLLVVVGGVYATRAEAEAADGQMSFGDLQGYYVVPVGQFQGFREGLGEPGDFALVSAFRTEEGARAFVDLAASFGHPATIASRRVRSLGGLYAGLGQEAHPDGSGPLLGPVESSLP